jgi:hypothetical protein
MADPLSVTASIVALVTAAIQSTKSLNAAVKRYIERDKTLRRLQAELDDLTKVLEALNTVCNLESSVMSLLEGPVSRCSQLYRDFEATMSIFSGKSRAGFRDWAKMEFMRGNIHEFIDALGGYKSTISVGLGTITISVYLRTLGLYSLIENSLIGKPPDYPTKFWRSIARLLKIPCTISRFT